MARPHGASPHEQLECDCAVLCVRARWGSALTTQSDVMARCGSLPSRHVKKERQARGASPAAKDAVGSAAARQSSFPALGLAPSYRSLLAVQVGHSLRASTPFLSCASMTGMLPFHTGGRQCACPHGEEPSIVSPESPLEIHNFCSPAPCW